MRLLNRPLAFVLAVALAAAGAIVVVEVIAFAVNADPVIVHWPTWVSWARRTQWNDAVIKTWAIVLIVVGAALLLLELKPRRVIRLKVQSKHDATDAALTRAGLSGAVRAAVLDIDGVSKAAVSVRRRSVSVAATSAARSQETAQELTAPVTQAAEERVAALQLKHAPRVKVRIASRSN